MPPKALLLSDYLLDADDDELGRLEWREADDHDHLAAVDISLSHGIAQPAAHEIGVRRFLALKRPGAEETVHEGLDVEPERRPQEVVVALEYGPLDPLVNALLDQNCGAPDGTLRVQMHRMCPGRPLDQPERSSTESACRDQP